MKYNHTLENGNYKDLGLPYLKGILHTYQALNQPDTTLRYEYDIVRVEKINRSIIETLTQRFDLLKHQSFELVSISDEELQRYLTGWLFETKFVSGTKVRKEITFFYEVLKEIIGYNSCFVITGLDSASFTYDLGIHYHYFVLESEICLYVLYFNYSD